MMLSAQQTLFRACEKPDAGNQDFTGVSEGLYGIEGELQLRKKDSGKSGAQLVTELNKKTQAVKVNFSSPSIPYKPSETPVKS